MPLGICSENSYVSFHPPSHPGWFKLHCYHEGGRERSMDISFVFVSCRELHNLQISDSIQTCFIFDFSLNCFFFCRRKGWAKLTYISKVNLMPAPLVVISSTVLPRCFLGCCVTYRQVICNAPREGLAKRRPLHSSRFHSIEKSWQPPSCSSCYVTLLLLFHIFISASTLDW